jgi:hypothetical protein
MNTHPDFLKCVDLASTLAEVAPHELVPINSQLEAAVARYMQPLTAEERTMATQMGLSVAEWQKNKARAAAKERAQADLTPEERTIVAQMGLDATEFVALRNARNAATVALARLPEAQVEQLRAEHGGDLVKMHQTAKACGWTR